MSARRQIISSKNGDFRAAFRAFADNWGLYKSIGATVTTYKKVGRSFLSISWVSWSPDVATTVTMGVTWTSRPDHFDHHRVIRSATNHSRSGCHLTRLALQAGVGSVVMDGSIDGAPDFETKTGAFLPVQRVSAMAIITFPDEPPIEVMGMASY